MNRFFITLLLGTFFGVYGLYALITGTAYKAKSPSHARMYGALYLVCGVIVAAIAVLFYGTGV